MRPAERLQHGQKSDLEYPDHHHQESNHLRYPGANEKPAWQEDQTLHEFIDDLKLVNPSLDHRTDTPQPPLDFTKSITQAFNTTEFPSFSKRRDAAEDLSQHIFRPTWCELEKLTEPTPKTESENFRLEHSTSRESHNPSAERLEQITAAAELAHRQNIFAEALFQNETTSKVAVLYHLQMAQTLLEPMTYPKHSEDKYQDKLFDWLKENQHTFGPGAARKIVNEHFEKAWDHALDQPRGNARNKMMDTVETITQNYTQKLAASVSRDDPQVFKTTLDSLADRNQLLHQAINENQGFTHLPPEHRPDLPSDFHGLEQAETFANQLNLNAHNYQNPTHIQNPDFREALAHNITDFNIQLQQQKQLEDQDPSMSDWWFDDHERLHDIASTIDYLTRPHDPVFWKMVDNLDGATDEIITHNVIETAKKTALDAIRETLQQPDELQGAAGAYNALFHVYETNIKSDLIDKDVASYQEHIKDMEERSQKFAVAISDGAGFIQSDQHHPPEFPQSANQAGTYIAQVNDQLRELNLQGQIETDHHKALTFLVDKYTQANQTLITADLSHQNNRYQEMITEQTDTLRAIEILMRPR